MKYLIVILFLIIGTAAKAQRLRVPTLDTTTHQPNGSTILRPTYTSAPLFSVDDSTMGSHAIDSLKLNGSVVEGRKDGVFVPQLTLPATVSSFTKNAGRDSSILTLTNGTRFAVKDSVGSGGASDTTYTRITGNSLLLTQSNSKGLELRNYAAGINSAGNYVQISPQTRYVSEAYGSIGTVGSFPVSWSNYSIPIFASGSAPATKYVWVKSINNETPVEVMSLNSNGALTINQTNGTGAGQALSIGYGFQNINFNAYSAREISSNGVNPLYLSNTSASGAVQIRTGASNEYLMHLEATYGTSRLATRGLSVNTTNTIPSGAASIDMQDVTRGFLPPRVTTTQRDAMKGVLSVTVNSGGSGYGNTTVTFTGGGGSNANAVLVTSGGVITSVTINYTGTGYTSAPTATPSGGGSGASLTAVIGHPLGLTVFNTTTNKLEVWDGTTWQAAW